MFLKLMHFNDIIYISVSSLSLSLSQDTDVNEGLLPSHAHPDHATHIKKRCDWLEGAWRRAQSSFPGFSLVRAVQYVTSRSDKLFCPFRSLDTDGEEQPDCLLHHPAALPTAIPKIEHANDTKTLVHSEKVSRFLHNSVDYIYFIRYFPGAHQRGTEFPPRNTINAQRLCFVFVILHVVTHNRAFILEYMLFSLCYLL